MAHKYDAIRRYHWRKNQAVQLLVDGGEFYPGMLAAIDRARSYIYLEMYLFESGKVAQQFIHHLQDARTRGVDVYVLLDAYGSQKLNVIDRQRMQSAGIQLALYNPLKYWPLRRNLFRDHRKLLLIDGVDAYTGGAGINDEFDPACYPQHYWRDVMIHIQGSCVQDWQHLFESNWSQWHDQALQYTPQQSATAPGMAMGRVLQSRSMTHSDVIRALLKHIRSADQRIWLATAYFVPSRKIRRALIKKARAGIDVRVLVPGPYSDHPWARHMGRRYYERLLRNGVRIYEYQPRFMHMKMVLADHWFSTGSSNIDRWNFRWNLEANQAVRDEHLSARVKTLFEESFNDSLEIDLHQWRQRPLWIRLNIIGWSWVVRLLSWMSFNLKK